MKLIIHGNDLQATRNYFFEFKGKTDSAVSLNGDKILSDNFFQIAEGDSFFDNEKTIFVENLFSANKSNSPELKKIIDYVNSNKKLNLILWESTELSKTSLNLLKDAEVKNFSIPSLLFTFLDSLKPRNYKASVSIFNQLNKNAENELIWFMILRQFRLLLSAISRSPEIDETKRLAPWQSSKLKSQASLFGETKLKEIYKKLFKIEENHKTGKVSYGINKSIDFFLASL